MSVNLSKGTGAVRRQAHNPINSGRKKEGCSLSKVLWGIGVAAAAYLVAKTQLTSNHPNSNPAGDNQAGQLSRYLPPQTYVPSALFSVTRESFPPVGSCDQPPSHFAGSAANRVRNEKPNLRLAYKERIFRPEQVRLQIPPSLRSAGLGYRIQPGEADQFREHHPSHVALTGQFYSQFKNHDQIKEWIQNPIESGYLSIVTDPATGTRTNTLIGIDGTGQKVYVKAEKATSQWLDEILTHKLPNKVIYKRILGTNKKLLDIKGKVGFRKEGIAVFLDDGQDMDRSPKALAKLMKKRGASQNEVSVFLRNYGKVPFKSFNDEMRGIMNRYLAYMPPKHAKIPALLKNYVNGLRSGLDQMQNCPDFDPIAFAAWAHQELVGIHPFIDGNGRTARLIMNCILERAGYPSVVFPVDAEYTAAIVQDGHQPGHFANYLRDRAIPWVEQQFSKDQPCLEAFDCL